ncbi:MAG: DUF1670 domain-containing protein, partial [Chloroflexi bacterium]|nr:DUF1670 domain-containing protein [Chloroflexota bacterium]
QHWHQKAGDALAVAGTTNATLAWHYERAEQWGQAIHYHQRAIKRALLLGDHQTARMHNGRSLTLLTHHKIDEAEQLPLRLQRLQVLQIETWSSDNLAEADEIEALALQHNDQATLLHLMLTKLNYFVQQGRMDELRIVGNRAIALAHELGDPSIEVQTRNQVAYKIGTVIRDTETAYTIAQQATALAETMPNEPHLLATTLLTMTVIHLINRDLQLGRDCLARADAIVANHAELASLEPEFIFYRAIIAQLSGDWETTRTLQYQLVDIHRRANDFSGLQAALYNVAHIAMFLGQFEEAILYAQELLHYVIAHSSEADKYLIYTYRAFLAECYAMVADFDAAEETIGPVLHWLETAESGRAVTYGWTVVGILRFYQGDLEGAYQAHGRVLELAKHKGSITTSPLITYAEVAHLLGHTEEAEQVFEQVKGLIKPGIVTGNTTYFHYVHFLITDDRSHLASAREVMFKLADGLTDPQLRQDYLDRLPLHKDIEQYWQQDQPSLMKATLVRADLPMGKSISPTDMVEVSWTVDAGASDTQVGQQAGKLALRRHRLQRLVTEARAQGAAPTHADLAIAVDVSVRTVERDGAALEKAGTPLLTRGYVPK